MPTKARTTSERMRVESMVNEWRVLALVVAKVQVMMRGGSALTDSVE
jgi:hypothetical protein